MPKADRFVYVDWLRQGLSVEGVGEACELTTPFLDRHNDHLQVYATRRNGKIVISDDGYILSDLRTSGLEIDTPKRKIVLDGVLKGLGVRTENGQLLVEASAANLGQRLHSLVQAMLAINDMFVMAQPRVASFFFEDVRNFLDSHDIRYTPRVKLAGKSGYDHGVDFLIPKSRRRPERILQAIATPKKDNIFAYLWTLSDTRAAREGEAEAEAYAFLNDQEQQVGGDVIEALEAYKVVPACKHSRNKRHRWNLGTRLLRRAPKCAKGGRLTLMSSRSLWSRSLRGAARPGECEREAECERAFARALAGPRSKRR